jgi:hypothetical protein
MSRVRKSPAEVRHALELVGTGLTHAEIAAQLGIPVATLRNWRGLGSYAYLLGVYLGDGHLGSQGGLPRSLRIAMDAAYPGIVEEVAVAIRDVRGQRPWIGPDRRTNTIRIVSYWREWPCWLGRAYAYPRYQFSNRSDDIRTLFTDACDFLGVAWRPWGRYHVSVARREAVALLDRYVGLKT